MQDGIQVGVIIEQFLLVLQVRGRLSISKPAKQTLSVVRISLKNLNGAKIKEQLP